MDTHYFITRVVPISLVVLFFIFAGPIAGLLSVLVLFYLMNSGDLD